jgi:uncharacterized protein
MSNSVIEKSLDVFLQSSKVAELDNCELDIIMYGGEPLLNFDAVEFTMKEFARLKAIGRMPSKGKLSCVTNGSMITAEVAEKLLFGGVGVGISLDGDKLVNDCHRISNNNTNAFDQTINGITNCKSVGLKFGLSVTITESLINNRVQALEYLISLKPESIGFNLLMPTNQVKLKSGYAKRASKFLLDCFLILRDIGIYEDRIMRKVTSFSKSALYPYDCGAVGLNQIVVDPMGSVGVCHGYFGDAEHFAGNICDDDCISVLAKRLSEWENRTPLQIDECNNCISLGICGGGCPFVAKNNTGSIMKLDETFCTHAVLVTNWMIQDTYRSIHRELTV